MSRVLKSLLVFAGAGLLGPLVRFSTWPPSRFNALFPKSISNFLYDFILLLWPTQPMAAAEANIGRASAAALAIGANLILFAVIGVIVGLAARSSGQLAVAYAVVCVLLFAWEFWGAGFSFAHLGVLALAVALLVYAIPFWIVMRASAMPRSA